MNKHGSDEFENWLKMWPCLFPDGDKSQASVIRSLAQGPVNKAFTEFFVQRVRSDDWFETLRQNQYLLEQKQLASKRGNPELKKRKHAHFVLEAEKELEELGKIKAKLLKENGDKMKMLHQTCPKDELVPNQLDTQLKRKQTFRQLDTIQLTSTVFLNKLRAIDAEIRLPRNTTNEVDYSFSESYLATEQNTNFRKLTDVQTRVVKALYSITEAANCPDTTLLATLPERIQSQNLDDLKRTLNELAFSVQPSEVQAWMNEGIRKSITKIHQRMLKKDDMNGVMYLETLIANKIGNWSRVHWLEKQTNERMMSQIACSPVQKTLCSNRKAEALIAEREILRQKLMFYKNFCVDSYVKKFTEKMAATQIESDMQFGELNTHTNCAEDLVISLIKCWPSYKSQARASQAIVDELLCKKLPDVALAFREVSHCRVPDLETDIVAKIELKGIKRKRENDHEPAREPISLDLVKLNEVVAGLKLQKAKLGSKHLDMLSNLVSECESANDLHISM